MANPTLTDLIARVRVNVKDDSATSANQSLTDTKITGFINVGYRVVQRRYSPRLVPRTATQTGLSYGADGFSDTTAETNYARIHTLMLVSSGSEIYGVPLVKKDPDEFMRLRAGESSSNVAADAGTIGATYPMYWTGWREGTATVADQGKWRILIHPPAGASAVLAAIVELEQADLSNGNDSPDVTPEGCSVIEMIASYLAASVLGRSWAGSFLEVYPEIKSVVEWETKDFLRDNPRAKATGRA